MIDLKKVIASDLISTEKSGKGFIVQQPLDDIESSNFYVLRYLLQRIKTNVQYLRHLSKLQKA